MSFTEIRPSGLFFDPTVPSSIATRATGAVTLHLSGQVPRNEKGENVAVGDIDGQVDQVIRNIARVLESQGASLANVCRVVAYVTKREHVESVLDGRRRHFSHPFPAGTAVIVSGLRREEWLVEIEATATV